jgi:hypothetical protein
MYIRYFCPAFRRERRKRILPYELRLYLLETKIYENMEINIAYNIYSNALCL